MTSPANPLLVQTATAASRIPHSSFRHSTLSAVGFRHSALTMWSRLFIGSPDWHLLVAAIVPTFLVAWLAGRYTRRVVIIAMRALVDDTVATSSRFVRAPLRVVGFATFLLVFAALISPAFEIAGLRPRAGLHLRALNTWAFDSGLRVLFIAAGAFALIRTVSVGVRRFENDVNFGSGL